MARTAALTADMIRPAKGRFLRKLGALCEVEGIRCAYAQGPYPADGCAASASYAAAARRFIAEAGVTPVRGTPVCLPPADIGDAEDHVRPERREHYSRVYLDLVVPILGLDRYAANERSRHE